MKKLSTAVVLTMIALASCSSNSTEETTIPAEQDTICPTSGEELETAKLYVEHNATDADTGVHGLFGGEGWIELCIWDPSGEMILHVTPLGPLGDLGLADFFFESREPPNDEYSLDDLFTDFPEGEYRVGGKGFDGVARVGSANFTHDVPSEPDIVEPSLAEDEEEAEGSVTDPGDLVVRWRPVTTSVAGDPVEITAYEVIVTKVDHDDPDGLSLPVYDVHVGPEQTSLGVPEDFLEAETLYELEVLALEASGNQTIAVGFLTTSSGG
jgi:hypothetical protein